MELQEFIATTLVQIAHGIESASNQLKGTSARVNPPCVKPLPVASGGEHIYGLFNPGENFHRAVHKIEFDVAVTAEKDKETKGGIGVHVGSFALGTQGRSETSNGTISRIRFSVPMVFPLGDKP